MRDVYVRETHRHDFHVRMCSYYNSWAALEASCFTVEEMNDQVNVNVIFCLKGSVDTKQCWWGRRLYPSATLLTKTYTSVEVKRRSKEQRSGLAPLAGLWWPWHKINLISYAFVEHTSDYTLHNVQEMQSIKDGPWYYNSLNAYRNNLHLCLSTLFIWGRLEEKTFLSPDSELSQGLGQAESSI